MPPPRPAPLPPPPLGHPSSLTARQHNATSELLRTGHSLPSAATHPHVDVLRLLHGDEHNGVCAGMLGDDFFCNESAYGSRIACQVPANAALRLCRAEPRCSYVSLNARGNVATLKRKFQWVREVNLHERNHSRVSILHHRSP